uniref:RING-type domain-containing protein n=1 Tax=Oncorhynchus tshawytscha TaxID=74940 RepID=A0A8C8C416_ONCTS
MASNRQQQTGGGTGPGTSSSSTGGTTNANGATSVGGNVSTNVNNSSNVVPSRTLATTGDGLLVPAAAVQSPISLATLSRPSSSSSGTSRKRPLHQAPLYNGLLNSYEDKSNDFVCPICFEMIEEAHMTKCGHSFCYKCIRQSLEDSNRCPKCNYIIDNVDQLYPNFLVNELILKQKQRSDEKRLKMDHPVSASNGSRWQVFQDVLGTDQENLDLANVNLMLELLVQKKKQLEAESQAAQRQILMEFLKEARRNKREQLEQLQKELNFLEEDIKRVEEMSGLYSPMSDMDRNLDSTVPNFEAPSPAPRCMCLVSVCVFSILPKGKRQTWYNSTLASRRKRLTAHFEDLEQCYFSNRMTRLTDDSRNLNQLDDFMECLSKFTRYNSVRPLATLSYASDLYNGSSIVSSIEFDRDCDYFAIAGVTKKIKVFEYGTVIQDAVDIHYPVNEMTCNSKISCISWSSYHKNLLASSDYEGTVILWDGFTGQRSKVYQEHEKRCWSVDFNLMDPKLLASGSDDAKVKLWSTNLDNSVASIEAKANVCCVKFSPTSRYHLAFGCADHCVHYYDLRNTKQPIMVFKGHRKAVSYAKFVNGEEIVSASTDSQLKLWNVNKPHCLRSFKGHINEKNFVGLASNGDYVACGSENNSLYLYYKGLSKTLLTFKFDTVKSVLDKDKKEDDTNEFVSAVCWRAMPDGESNVLIAANSQGTIKVCFVIVFYSAQFPNSDEFKLTSVEDS